MNKRFFFLLLLGTMGFFSSKGVAAKLDPESHAALSDLGYAKHIEVKCYLVTREQLAKVFANGNEIVVQKTNKDLYTQDLFLLVRCRNRDKYGRLLYSFEVNILDTPYYFTNRIQNKDSLN